MHKGRRRPLPAATVADILRRSRADYIYAGPTARWMGAGLLDRALTTAGLADRAFANPRATVYRVNKDRVTRCIGGGPATRRASDPTDRRDK